MSAASANGMQPIGTSNNIQRAPEPAHDPIAIAALVAELRELEAKFAAATKAAEEANKALDVIQDRIDRAMQALRNKTSKGSKWGRSDATEIQMRMQQYQGQMKQFQDAAMQNAAANQWGQNAQNDTVSAPPMMISEDVYKKLALMIDAAPIGVREKLIKAIKDRI